MRFSLVFPLVVVMAFSGFAQPVTAEEPTEEKAPNSILAKYDRGFRFATRDNAYALRINGGIQVRWTYVDYDPAIRYNQEDYSNFFVRRARLYFSGHVGSPKFQYLVHVQLEPNQGLNANDLWVEYRFSDWFQLGAGRNKISYGLEMLNSGSALGLVERSLMYGETDIDLGNASEPGPKYPGGGTNRFGLSSSSYGTGFATGGLNLYRSQGIQLRGKKGSDTTSTFEYQLGLWQGRSTNSLANSGSDHLLSLRVGYHPWGFVDWKVVGDVEGSEHFKLGILGSIYTNRSDDPEKYKEGGANLALMARWRGWSADFEWAHESFDYENSAVPFDREGWRVSLGWYVVPERWAIRARYAEIQRMKNPSYQKAVDSGLGIPEVLGGEDWIPALEAKISEITVGASVQILGWRNKLVFDLSRLTREFAADPDAVIAGESAPIAKAPNQVDYRVRAMVQLVF
jgi:Phosphate-selective porin O and P